ncbi:hypothetical protein ACL58G_07810 [Massilia sp. GER05]|uniref:hypothetical protein n=1 Tax=Massilia sp. GER05 TaxID=3394605 RepID=UPI003F845574
MNLTTESSTSTNALPEAWIERLFERMLLEYGKRFGDQWAQANMDKLIAHWAAELAGYSGAELKRGVDALASRDWPPTLPEFKRMCRPPVDPMRAYYEAVAGVQARFAGEHGTWSHPAIYWAAMPMAVELREQTFSAVKARWETALADQLGRGEWETIPAPMLQLTAPGQSTTSSAKAREAIKQLVGQIVHKPADGDPKGWARRILDRHKAGEKITPTQLSMAQDALQAGA